MYKFRCCRQLYISIETQLWQSGKAAMMVKTLATTKIYKIIKKWDGWAVR